MSIAIGIIHGDIVVATSRLGASLGRIMDALDENRKRKTELLVNIIFLTHGALCQPLADGVVLHRHSRVRNSIIVHIGVPKRFNRGGKAVPFLFKSLREAIDLVQQRMAQRRVSYDPTRDLRRINQLERTW